MRLAEDYVRLRAAFPESKEDEPFHLSMGNLAKLLFCTTRNAKLLLMKMKELGWIVYRPGRGRGNLSEIMFLMPAETVIMEEAQDRVKHGNVSGAFQWLNEHRNLAPIRPRFMAWLADYFGYKQEWTEDDRMTDTLRLPIYRPIVSLDPATAIYSFDTHLIEHVYSRLADFDASSGSFSEGIAHTWETNDDATVWTFYLYKGVRFHDGTELTAYDVSASLSRLAHTGVHGWLVQDVMHMEVASAYTIRFVLSRPNRQFLLYMSHSAASILPAGRCTVEVEQDLPVGSGPYRIVEKLSGRCVLSAFPAYAGRPAIIDRIEVIIVPENEAEACWGTSPGVLTVMTGELKDQTHSGMPQQMTVTGVLMMTMNRRRRGMLDDPNIRKVLVDGVDRNRMIDELGFPRVSTANGFRLHPEAMDSIRLPVQVYSSYNPIHPDKPGSPLQLYTFGRHEPDAHWLRQQYEAKGIPVHVHTVSWGELLNPCIQDAADLILFEAVLSEGPIRLLEYIQSRQSFLRGSLPEELLHTLDEHTAEFLQSREPEAAYKWIANMEQILNGTCSCVFLVNKAVSTLHHPSMQGVRINTKGWVDFRTIWFKEI